MKSTSHLLQIWYVSVAISVITLAFLVMSLAA